MGRIRDPELILLAEQWSPVVLELLDEVGKHQWPPKRIRRSLFAKPEIVHRFSLEGPAQIGGALTWALSHTLRPSSFDDYGVLSEGKRAYWLVLLSAGEPPVFAVRGAQTQEGIAAERDSLAHALTQARRDGPVVESYYGNKGPLSHR